MKTYQEGAPAGGYEPTLENDPPRASRFWSRFAAQIPVIILTATLVIGVTAWFRDQDAAQFATQIATLRAQNDALRAQGEANHHQLEATDRLLKDAVARRDAGGFRSEGENQALSNDRIAVLAEAIAQKVVPAIPAPISAADRERLQDQQVAKVAARLTDDLRPIILGVAADQNATAQSARKYEDHLRELDHKLAIAEGAAQDALKLSHEVTALYLGSFKDQGMLMRLISLPPDLVFDAAHLNLVTRRDRTKVRAELFAAMDAIDRRLHQIQSPPPANATKG